MNKQAFAIIISIVLLSSFIITVCYAQETFTVPASQEVDRIISLNRGDTLQGNFNVTGGLGNDINFAATDTNNNIILQYNHTSTLNFSFNAQENGKYTLHFINSFSPDFSKSITLDYHIVNMSIVYLVTIVGLAVIVAIIIVGVMLWRRSSVQKSR
jgi:hypothetical protein